MQRTVAASVRREIDRQESAEALLVFLTIEQTELADPIRVVADSKDFEYGGNLFTGFLFDIELLTDREQPPEARLSIQNVDQKIGNAVRGLTEPPRVKIEVLPLSEFDTTVEPRTPISTATAIYTADKLFLVDISVDAMTISGRLKSWDYTQETWPGVRATQNRCPGLFR